MDKYDFIQKIGKGSYGKVFKAKVRETGQVVAIKKTRSDFMEDGVPISSLREIANLKMLSRCKHIVKLLAVETEQYVGRKLSIYLVFEFMDCDLKNFYSRCASLNKQVPPIIIKKMMQQLLKGLEYCHRHGVMHRDLKPQNLLLDLEPGVLKIADFGLGRVLRKKFDSYTEEVITLWYRPPELLLGESKYTFAIDIWSVGCIFAELCLMRALFRGRSQVTQLLEIFQKCLHTILQREFQPGKLYPILTSSTLFDNSLDR
eukprot:PITA_03884